MYCVILRVALKRKNVLCANEESVIRYKAMDPIEGNWLIFYLNNNYLIHTNRIFDLNNHLKYVHELLPINVRFLLSSMKVHF